MAKNPADQMGQIHGPKCTNGSRVDEAKSITKTLITRGSSVKNPSHYSQPPLVATNALPSP